ncbi:MAG: SgcJ/EcaC family oxidoreductase [Pseudomonadota bacterium]|nr:SgcJ/EcaC family oxidoreductase [Pseudomonadota bacterium]
MNPGEITALFDKWNAALQSGSPKNVVDLYKHDAILLPTISNLVRHNHKEIEDYFVLFLEQGPQGKINEFNIRLYGEIATNSGIYTFTLRDGSEVQARFTFVYEWNGERWLIAEHHSSRMPE